jgi:hypothetical protein
MKDDTTKMEAKLDKLSDDTKTIIKENFKSVKDDTTKMEAKLDTFTDDMNTKLDKISDDMKKINVALFVGILVLASIQPELRSLVSIIIKLINI